MNNTRQQQIALIIHANVGSLFAMMLNYRYRGPKFKWSKFPQMCETHAKTDWLHIQFDKPSQAELDLGAGIAVTLAEKLIGLADLSDNSCTNYEQIGYAYIAKKSGEVYISRNEDSPHRFPIYRKVT